MFKEKVRSRNSERNKYVEYKGKLAMQTDHWTRPGNGLRLNPVTGEVHLRTERHYDGEKMEGYIPIRQSKIKKIVIDTNEKYDERTVDVLRELTCKIVKG